nr:MAG TPA: hypothetical protein [Caudoviricetes sp.]
MLTAHSTSTSNPQTGRKPITRPTRLGRSALVSARPASTPHNVGIPAT